MIQYTYEESYFQERRGNVAINRSPLVSWDAWRKGKNYYDEIVIQPGDKLNLGGDGPVIENPRYRRIDLDKKDVEEFERVKENFLG